MIFKAKKNGYNEYKEQKRAQNPAPMNFHIWWLGRRATRDGWRRCHLTDNESSVLETRGCSSGPRAAAAFKAMSGELVGLGNVKVISVQDENNVRRVAGQN